MKAAAAVGAAVALAALLPGVAAAHPRLDGTTPSADTTLATPPSRVVIRFSEPVTPVGDGISVTGPNGSQVATGAVVRAKQGAILARAIDARSRGSYVVEWLVVGDDTHPARGVFVFSVGTTSEADLPGSSHDGIVLQALGRWLAFAGFALGFGLPFAALLSGGMTPPLWRLVTLGIVSMIVAEPVALLGQTRALSPARAFDAGFARDVLQTSYGRDAALRLGAALGLWALAGALRGAPPRSLWAIPALGAGLALVHADAAHRVPGLPGPASLLLAAAHVASFAAWLGCIVVALVAGRSRELARPAVLAALVLVISGSGLALGQLGSFSDLVDTAYGQTLAVKIAIVAGAFALGSAGRRRAELAAALTALAAAAVLVSLLPPLA